MSKHGRHKHIFSFWIRPREGEMSPVLRGKLGLIRIRKLLHHSQSACGQQSPQPSQASGHEDFQRISAAHQQQQQQHLLLQTSEPSKWRFTFPYNCKSLVLRQEWHQPGTALDSYKLWGVWIHGWPLLFQLGETTTTNTPHYSSY